MLCSWMARKECIDYLSRVRKIRIFLSRFQKAVDMLLDNEDKISVSSPALCLLMKNTQTLFTGVSRLFILTLFLQVDRVVEELKDRPELLHVVRSDYSKYSIFFPIFIL